MEGIVTSWLISHVTAPAPFSSYLMLRLIFNFYRNTKTLQVQGRAAKDVRDILEEVVNNKLLVERSTEETIVLPEHNMPTEEPPERTIPENITVMDDPREQAEQDSITSDSAEVKIEIEKLWIESS